MNSFANQLAQFCAPTRAFMRDRIFYSDGNGIRSHAGWYFKGQDGIPVGPFHTEYSAEEALIDYELSEETPK